MTDRDRLGADSLREIRERANETLRLYGRAETAGVEKRVARGARDVLALVAEREAWIAAFGVRPLDSPEVAAAFVRELAESASEAEGRVAVLEAALRDALNGLPDAMHPHVAPEHRDGLVNAQIVMWDALGHDDPGNVEAARRALREADALPSPGAVLPGGDVVGEKP